MKQRTSDNARKIAAQTAAAMVAKDLQRQYELYQPLTELIPELPLGIAPAVLFLLGREDDAFDLAFRVARIALYEDDREVTKAAIFKLVREKYLTPELVAAAPVKTPATND